MPSVYETYLCREPANDVPMLMRNAPDEYTSLLRTLQRSADYFAERDQNRAVERLQLEMARLHMKNQQWDRATRVLVPLWQTLTWRRAGWWQLIEDIDWTLRECASQLKDKETLLAVEWELLNNSLTPRQEWHYDFSKALEGFRPLDSRPRSILRAENTLSCISATFAFVVTEGHVGEILPSQIVISSRGQRTSSPITISQIKVAFEGGLRNLTIQHDSTSTAEASTADRSVQLHTINLLKARSDSSTVPSSPVTPQVHCPLIGSADLAIAPGATKALSLNHTPRDAADVEVTSITLLIKEEDFDLEVVITEDDQMQQESVWVPNLSGLSEKRLKLGRSNAVKVLPKPPKLQIEVLDLAPIYFTDEAVVIDLRITNEEDDEVNVTLDARLLGQFGEIPKITWAPGEDRIEYKEDLLEGGTLFSQSSDQLPSKELGYLATSQTQRHKIRIQATSEPTSCALEVKALYYLLSDPETPITKFILTDIGYMQPFEASYSASPMIHTDPWPSYFDADGLDESPNTDSGEGNVPRGLTQQWSLTFRLANLAAIALFTEGVEAQVIGVHEGAVCSTALTNHSEEHLIFPNDHQACTFVVTVQKLDLEDRRPTFLDLRLQVKWRRQHSSQPPIITRIPVSELTIPFGEPRVLAAAHYGHTPLGVIHLDYTIENPSVYTLTFNLTMDTNEEFAFSGPKNMNVQLVPLSRHTVRYNLLPMVKGAWISPQLRVFDTHFHKTLKVNATGEMRNEKRGVGIWVDAEG